VKRGVAASSLLMHGSRLALSKHAVYIGRNAVTTAKHANLPHEISPQQTDGTSPGYPAPEAGGDGDTGTR
jgi:hypothetical protein